MAIPTTELLRASHSWDETPLPAYPAGKPELIVRRHPLSLEKKTAAYRRMFEATKLL